MILKHEFYSRPPQLVARALIGQKLVRTLSRGEKLEGIIVETEAYGGFDDPASHAFVGKTKRNEAMFEEAGHAYVYFTYGAHHCLNFVTGKEGSPSAVLIRAIEPTRGIEKMLSLRRTMELKEIASGPGKICQAFAIDRSLNKVDVTRKLAPIRVIECDGSSRLIHSSRRIGIRKGKEKQWRFYDAKSACVSRRPSRV